MVARLSSSLTTQQHYNSSLIIKFDPFYNISIFISYFNSRPELSSASPRTPSVIHSFYDGCAQAQCRSLLHFEQ
jgi:hypothetical protein